MTEYVALVMAMATTNSLELVTNFLLDFEFESVKLLLLGFVGHRYDD